MHTESHTHKDRNTVPIVRTGIFGGSFNPIHNGHITLARQLAAASALDEVWFMVSPQNPLKDAGSLMPDDVRLGLVRRALAEEPVLRASDYEFHLPRPSYTWNTLQSLTADFPYRRFALLIGGDNWQLFPRWYHSADIVSKYPVIVYPRRNEDTGNIASDVTNEETEACPTGEDMLSPGVHFVRATLLDISSTMIRSLVRQGRSVHGLVPPQIEDEVVRIYASEEENGLGTHVEQ